MARKISAGWSAANATIEKHPLAFDTVTVAFDAIAVIGGVFAVATLGVAGVGALGLLAAGAGLVLLCADGTHYAFEAEGKFAQAKAIEENPVYQTVEWVAPILCLPDLVVNMPKAFREAGNLVREAGVVEAEADKAAGAAASSENKLQNYIAKRAATPDNPAKLSTTQRYQRQINAAKRAAAAVQEKFGDAVREARVSGVRAGFAGIGAIGTHYGMGVLVAHPPQVPDYALQAAHAARQAAASGWQDMGARFSPAMHALPVPLPAMPDASAAVFHRGFRGGFYSHAGDDPMADMQAYLSIHMAVVRVRPR